MKQLQSIRLVGLLVLASFFSSWCLPSHSLKAQSEATFIANPTLFATRSRDERCRAISLWEKSIIYEARKSLPKRVYSRGFVGNDQQLMDSVVRTNPDKQELSTIHFRGIFGKYLHELSEKERKEIPKTVEKCPTEGWMQGSFLFDLAMTEVKGRKTPLSDWLQMSREQWEQDQEKLRVAAYSKKLSADAIKQDRSYFDNYADAVPLIDDPNYRLYGKYFEWCTPHQAYLTLILKGDENYEVKNNEEYMKRFDTEILPVVLKHCRPSRISVEHHIAGKYRMGYLVSDNPDPRGWTSERLSAVLFLDFDVNINKYKRPDWENQVASLAEVRKLPELNALARKRYDEKLVAEAKENERKAVIKRQERAAANAPSQRIKAAGILRLLGAASIKTLSSGYDFTHYRQKEDLNNIFVGNFLPFSGDYEKEDLEKAVSTLDSTTIFNVGRLRSRITMAYAAYHRSFEENCRSNNSIEWVEVKFRRPGTVTTNGFGIEVGRTPEENFQFWIREPFAESFKRSFIAINSGDGVSQLFAGLSETVYYQFKNDFKTFLVAEKCSSPAVSQFELNLHLANEWMLPLQVLYQPRN